MTTAKRPPPLARRGSVAALRTTAPGPFTAAAMPELCELDRYLSGVQRGDRTARAGWEAPSTLDLHPQEKRRGLLAWLRRLWGGK